MNRLSRLQDRIHDRDDSSRRGKHEPGRVTCLLTPLPKGKELSLALVHCLSEEIPDVRFTLDVHEEVDAVWVCGYGERAAVFLGRLRVLHPRALIVVTGRAPAMTWGPTVLAAGADYACSWPVDYCLLGRILRQKHIPPPNETNHRLDLELSGPMSFRAVGW